jgi:hypothetical protein
VKLYKYRDFSEPDQVGFGRLQAMLSGRAFWCARPDTLNDPEEFAWTCDFSESPDTADLLTDLLIQVVGRPRDQARHRAVDAIKAGRLRVLAEPIIANMIHQCRNEVGLACFGTSPDNQTLWQRYAGRGAGVCVELEVPDSLLGTQLHHVQYSDAKRIHIDQFLRARMDRSNAADVYALSLLSKPSCWAPEAEVRFISRRQGISVVIDGSVTTRVVLGDALTPAVIERIRQIAAAIPIVSRGSGVTT